MRPLMNRKYFIVYVLIILTVTGCMTTSGIKTAEYKQTASEIEDIVKRDTNLTPMQKVVLKHAIVNLREAEKKDQEVIQLQKQVVSESKLAGAGKMVYVLIGFIIFLIVSVFGFRVMKKFSVF